VPGDSGLSISKPKLWVKKLKTHKTEETAATFFFKELDAITDRIIKWRNDTLRGVRGPEGSINERGRGDSQEIKGLPIDSAATIVL
jgi:hypothetical protein